MLLELKQVKKYFPVKKGFFPKVQGYVKAIDYVDLKVNKGENVSLVGESGSGKTTLGRSILKLMPIDSGKIIFENKDITSLSRNEWRTYHQNIQMVFQDPYSSLDSRFTVRRIILEAMTYEKGLSSGQKIEKIKKMLTEVNLPADILERYPHEFSGGERQRIAIARALVMNPKLLILDEAVSSLDVLVQEQILNLLNDIQKKYQLTYLFISHNLRVVKKISTRIAVMYKGKIVELAETDELFNNPLHPYTKELLSAAISYKSIQGDTDFKIENGARLIDNGKGHFVIG